MSLCGTIGESCLPTQARMAARAMTRIYDAALRPLDLKVTQMALLVAADASDGRRTITELGEALAIERSTMSRNLDLLERRGLIELGPETQHRARHVRLTTEGRALLERALPIWRGVQEKMRLRLGGRFELSLESLKELARAG